MVTIRQLVHQKGNKVYSATPDTPIMDVLKLLGQKDIGAVVVLEGAKIVGIFSERDLARHLAKDPEFDIKTPVKKLMTKQIFFVRPDQAIDDCMVIMSQKHIRHLPVLDGENLVGVISIGDVVKEIISDKEVTIRSLENYILGREYNQ